MSTLEEIHDFMEELFKTEIYAKYNFVPTLVFEDDDWRDIKEAINLIQLKPLGPTKDVEVGNFRNYRIEYFYKTKLVILYAKSALRTIQDKGPY